MEKKIIGYLVGSENNAIDGSDNINHWDFPKRFFNEPLDAKKYFDSLPRESAWECKKLPYIATIYTNGTIERVYSFEELPL